jgi:hypothetical protein
MAMNYSILVISSLSRAYVPHRMARYQLIVSQRYA